MKLSKQEKTTLSDSVKKWVDRLEHNPNTTMQQTVILTLAKSVLILLSELRTAEAALSKEQAKAKRPSKKKSGKDDVQTPPTADDWEPTQKSIQN